MGKSGPKKKPGDRYKCGRLRPLPADHGTLELARQFKIVPRLTTDAGIIGVMNAQECLLDRLLGGKALGNGRKAADRYGAGIWLRGLYERAFAQRIIATYAEPSPAGDSDGPGPPTFRYYRVLLAMGDQWYITRKICIEGALWGEQEAIQSALDRLFGVKQRHDYVERG